MRALREIPDPPCDLRAARLELRRRTRHVIVWRRLAVGAIVIAAAVMTLALLQDLPRRDSSLPPIKQLPSGLPIGTLTGRLHTQLHTPEGKVFPLFLRLVVRPDGTCAVTGGCSPVTIVGVDLRGWFCASAHQHRVAGRQSVTVR
jgi:hypothetical protein